MLRFIEHPILLVGPRVPVEVTWRRPTPILCVAPDTAVAVAVAAVEAWTQTFPGEPPWIVEVVPTGATGNHDDDERESARVRRVADLLKDRGVESRWKILHGGSPEFWLEDFAEHVPEPVFITISSNWTGGHRRRSTSRRLVHRSMHPVLVVPVSKRTGR